MKFFIGTCLLTFMLISCQDKNYQADSNIPKEIIQVLDSLSSEKIFINCSASNFLTFGISDTLIRGWKQLKSGYEANSELKLKTLKIKTYELELTNHKPSKQYLFHFKFKDPNEKLLFEQFQPQSNRLLEHDKNVPVYFKMKNEIFLMTTPFP